MKIFCVGLTLICLLDISSGVNAQSGPVGIASNTFMAQMLKMAQAVTSRDSQPNTFPNGLLPGIRDSPYRFDVGSGSPVVNVNSTTLEKLAAITASILDDPLNGVIYSKKLAVLQYLAAFYSTIGLGECHGLDHTTGLPIASLWFGTKYDFGGASLCNISCDGTCAPFSNTTAGAPPSGYPFSCDCTTPGCNANGPIRNPDFTRYIPFTNVQCTEPTSACQCGTLVGKPEDTGYLCNWIVADNAYLRIGLPPSTSLIRWCDCCTPESANIPAPSQAPSPVNANLP